MDEDDEREQRMEQKRLEEQRIEQRKLEQKRLEEQKVDQKRLEQLRKQEQQKRIEGNRIRYKRMQQERMQPKNTAPVRKEPKRSQTRRQAEVISISSGSDDDSGRGNVDEKRKRLHSTTRSKASNTTDASTQSLRTRLAAFLPKLHSANESLLVQTAAQRARRGFEVVKSRDDDDDDDDDEDNDDETTDHGDAGPYIELNLGLGVLEEHPRLELSRSPFQRLHGQLKTATKLPCIVRSRGVRAQ